MAGSSDGTWRGKVVLLTGASEGIGRALALELAPRGARLALVARNAERLEALAAECRALGADARAVPADLGRLESVAGVVEATLAAFGRLDVLVNNAGMTMWSRFDALQDLGVLEQLMRVNYLASAWLTQAALPQLRRDAGLIVAVASVAGLTGVPERTGYAASKHAMIGFFESLRIELAGSGVDVTIIAPDFVRSEIHRRAIGADGRPLGETPMQESRIMTAEHCAHEIREAMEARQRLRVTSGRARWGLRLKPFLPALIDWIAARAIRERR
jgi:short-subunit dehydrogenase